MAANNTESPFWSDVITAYNLIHLMNAENNMVTIERGDKGAEVKYDPQTGNVLILVYTVPISPEMVPMVYTGDHAKRAEEAAQERK